MAIPTLWIFNETKTVGKTQHERCVSSIVTRRRPIFGINKQKWIGNDRHKKWNGWVSCFAYLKGRIFCFLFSTLNSQTEQPQWRNWCHPIFYLVILFHLFETNIRSRRGVTATNWWSGSSTEVNWKLSSEEILPCFSISSRERNLDWCLQKWNNSSGSHISVTPIILFFSVRKMIWNTHLLSKN